MAVRNFIFLNIICLIVFYESLSSTFGLLCYNGTLSNNQFGEDPLSRNNFLRDRKFETRIRCSLTIRCPETALCFLRSWRARAKHAWIVQRGCYELTAQDTPPVALSEARTMSCKKQRLPDGEYKLCFCQGDQCNRSYQLRYERVQLFVVLMLYLFLNFDV